MIIIKVNNTYSYYIGTVYPEILEKCTLSQMQFYRIKGTGEIKRKESKRCYFLKDSNKFPTGWIFSHIIPTLKQMGIEYTIIDEREEIVNNKLKVNYEFKPYNYQQECISLCTTEGKERGIISIATGGGKTFVASNIVAYYGQKTLYIVPSLLLLYQTEKEFIRWFGKKKVGIVGDGEFSPALITIATAQTLWSRKEDPKIKEILENCKVLIMDEAHKISRPTKQNKYMGNTWYTIAMKACNAKIRLGFTATPGKEESYSHQLLKACTGKVIYTKTLSELMMEGYLTKLKVILYENIISNQINTWSKAYSANIIGNESRNKLIIDKAVELADESKRVLIIVNRIERHGKVLMDMFLKYYPSIEVESLYGSDNSEIRKDVLKRFVNFETKIIVSTIIREGVDLPAMDAIIIALAGKGGEAGRDLIQKLGRVVRKCKNKESATLIDIFDNDGYIKYLDTKGIERAKPCILLRHSNQRLKIYESEPMIEIIRK